MTITTTSESCTKVRGLGEVALRVNNLDAMQKFYEEVIGSRRQSSGVCQLRQRCLKILLTFG